MRETNFGSSYLEDREIEGLGNRDLTVIKQF